MKNSKTLFQDFVNRVTLKESRDEIQSMAYLVFENIFGLSKTEVMAEKDITMDASTQERLNEIVTRVNRCEPIQYILGESFFFGRIFKVSPAVLIPRPETAELVQFVIDFVQRNKRKNLRILDVGTGSGCIAITLSLALPNIESFATDVSEEALAVASANARALHANVNFINHDIVNNKLPFSIDIFVSNPPYIAWSEFDTMAKNVVDYEPKLALFVESSDPLLFYKAIVKRAKESLTPEGLLAVEINERFGRDVQNLFVENDFYDVEIVQDVFGKDRIVKGVLSS